MSKLLKAYDRSRVPLYIQVAAIMRQRIERGQWRPAREFNPGQSRARVRGGARSPSDRPSIFCARKDCCIVIRAAARFVAKKPPTRHWLELATDWAILINSIKDNVPKRIKVDHPPAFPELHEGEGTLATNTNSSGACNTKTASLTAS